MIQNTKSPNQTNIDQHAILETFESMVGHQYHIRNTSLSERKAKLKNLLKIFLKYRDEIKKAVFEDCKKHPSEVDMVEIYPVVSEIKHALKHISYWMRDKPVPTPLGLMGTSSYIKYEPKGVVLIISPWNFPINLTFCPLVLAVAAGNCVIVKPSEISSRSSEIMNKILMEAFPSNEVCVVEGGVETSTYLLCLPFNHIFFTGAPSIGKIVMQAASKHLASVTLELGGKSPTIVDNTANVDHAARRIVWAKFVSTGQMCIAPDHVFVHNEIKQIFLDKVKFYIHKFYTSKPEEEPSYGRMVNSKHFDRVTGYIEDAIDKGANIWCGGKIDKQNLYIDPTVLTEVDPNSSLMTEEIFGPILPINFYDDLDDLLTSLNKKDKPLALYIFSRNQKNIDHILKNTRSGGGCINHCAVHFYNTYLPFGGSNNSGIGKSHGYEGFKAFSNDRGILEQKITNALELLVPPYDNFKNKLIDLTVKYF